MKEISAASFVFSGIVFLYLAAGVVSLIGFESVVIGFLVYMTILLVWIGDRLSQLTKNLVKILEQLVAKK